MRLWMLMLLMCAITVIGSGCGIHSLSAAAGSERADAEERTVDERAVKEERSVQQFVYGEELSVFKSVYETTDSEELKPQLPDSVRPPFPAPIRDSY